LTSMDFGFPLIGHVVRAALVVVSCCSQAHASSQKQAWYEHTQYPGFGEVVASAGDVDRDGVPDLAIGDPGLANEGDRPRVWIVSGRDYRTIRTFPLRPSDADSQAMFRIEGGHDVNGDNVPDLLVAMAPFSSKLCRVVSILSGADGSPLCTIDSPNPLRSEGNWAQFTADYDGDGVDDIAVNSLDAKTGAGRVRIYSSHSGKVLNDTLIEDRCLHAASGFVIVPDANRPTDPGVAILFGQTKSCVASVHCRPHLSGRDQWVYASGESRGWCYGQLMMIGDVDADSVGDIAVSLYDRVDVLSGKTGLLLHRLQTDPAFHNATPDEPERQTGFGWAMARLNDVDRDGVMDFALSETQVGMGDGVVMAFSGRNGKRIWSVTGDGRAGTCQLGYQLAAVGDVDGDGCCDLIAGSTERECSMPGRAMLLSGKDGHVMCEFRRSDAERLISKQMNKVPSSSHLSGDRRQQK
jgi:hypothetical protein